MDIIVNFLLRNNIEYIVLNEDYTEMEIQFGLKGQTYIISREISGDGKLEYIVDSFGSDGENLETYDSQTSVISMLGQLTDPKLSQ